MRELDKLMTADDQRGTILRELMQAYRQSGAPLWKFAGQMLADDAKQIATLTARCEALARDIDELRSRLSQCAAAVPTSWLDDILTGPNAVIREQPWGCPEVERILSAVRKRIEAIATPIAGTAEGEGGKA